MGRSYSNSYKSFKSLNEYDNNSFISFIIYVSFNHQDLKFGRKNALNVKCVWRKKTFVSVLVLKR